MTIQKQKLYYEIKINAKEINKLCSNLNKEINSIISYELESINKINDLSQKLIDIFSSLNNSIKNTCDVVVDLNSKFVGLVNNSNSILSIINNVNSTLNKLDLELGTSKLIDDFDSILSKARLLHSEIKGIDNLTSLKVNSNLIENNGKGKYSDGYSKNNSSSNKTYYKNNREESIKGIQDFSNGVSDTAEIAGGLATASYWLDLISIGAAETISGVGLIAAAVTKVLSLIVQVQLNSDNVNNKIVDSVSLYQSVEEALADVSKTADSNFLDQMLDANKVLQYEDAIKSLVDEHGNLIGSKEELISAVNGYNKSMGDSVLIVDEDTGKLSTQIGKIEDLDSTLDKIDAERTAEIFINTHTEEYEKAIVLQEQLKNQSKEMFDEYKNIKSQYSEDDFNAMMLIKQRSENDEYINNPMKLQEDFKNFGIDADTFNKFNTEMSGVLASLDVYSEKIKEIDDVVIKPFENVDEMLSTKDEESLLKWKENFDLSTMNESMQAYFDKIKELKDQINVSEEMSNPNGLNLYINEEQLQQTKDELALLKEEFLQIFGLDYDVLEEEGLISGNTYGLAVNKGLDEQTTALADSIIKNVENGTTDATTALTTLINAYVPPTIWVPVKMKIIDSLGKEVFNGDSSYDDSQTQSIIQPNWMNDAVGVSRNIFSNLQKRITSTITVGIPVSKLSFENAGSTAITQNVSFNQPIQKPSDVTRAMQKASRNLRKVK
ncbi:hypothetical protein [Anaerorhabdus sp.]|uniref:hypothetical protein n=1 Tax=Anaerorhabdus sp. TaxID=1872524 RepID=UPI002B207372|nr:hypothetical protein [Anaerorhabdus sp.]MEA4875397.1 hypothetical protein [Anaerorhabdus sp.]